MTQTAVEHGKLLNALMLVMARSPSSDGEADAAMPGQSRQSSPDNAACASGAASQVATGPRGRQGRPERRPADERPAGRSAHRRRAGRERALRNEATTTPAVQPGRSVDLRPRRHQPPSARMSVLRPGRRPEQRLPPSARHRPPLCMAAAALRPSLHRARNPSPQRMCHGDAGPCAGDALERDLLSPACRSPSAGTAWPRVAAELAAASRPATG